MKLFAGNSTPALAQKVASHLKIELGKATVSRFSDGEILVEILENVRGQDVFVLQSTCYPTNENIMELLIMVDALRRASAKRLTAVVPYYGYARQDRRVRSRRVPISAKVVADLMMTVGISRLLTVDLHADQIQGFFDIPVDNVYGSTVMYEDMKRVNGDDAVIVSPDVGGVVRARAIAKQQGYRDLAIIDKRRPADNLSEVMHIIGDVADRKCVLVDDMIDTAGTICTASKALKEAGASSVSAYITHPVLSGNAIENIEKSMLDELVVSDTIPLSERASACKRIRVISLSQMLAEAIQRVSEEESISSMFS